MSDTVFAYPPEHSALHGDLQDDLEAFDTTSDGIFLLGKRGEGK